MEHGPAGPLAIAHLLGVAKLNDDDGRFGIYWDALASAIYVRQPARVKAIIAQAEEIEVLTVERRDAKGFGGCFPGWMSWQWDHQRRAAADRQADKRLRDKSVTSVTEKSRSERDKSVTTVTETDTEEAKASSTTSEHDDFAAWLTHHAAITAMRSPRPGTKARAKVAGMYGARRGEGYGADDLCLATVGAFSDPYRKQHGHYGCESVLRPEKVHDLVEKGRRGGPVAVPAQEHPASRRIRELDQLKAMLPPDEGEEAVA